MAVERRTTSVFFVIAVLVAAQAQAQSRAMGSFQGVFTPHLGASVGGDVSQARITPGLSVADWPSNAVALCPQATSPGPVKKSQAASVPLKLSLKTGGP